MRKLSCIVLSVMLILSAGFPGAMAVCYQQCQRFDIWQRCYVNEEDRSGACICIDENGDGCCDGCSDQLCYTDDNGDGQCDAQKACIRREQKNSEMEKAVPGQHRGMGSHHGGGRKNCR